MPTQLEIGKAALAQIGTRTNITSFADPSSEAKYLTILYPLLRDFLLVEGDYDFSLNSSTIAVSGTPLLPWLFQYPYPAGALRIRQLVPQGYNALDPRPVEWTVNSQGGTKRIWTMQAMNIAIYTFAVSELLWRADFTESFVRLLSSALAFSLENKVELSKEKLTEALTFAGIANLRDS